MQTDSHSLCPLTIRDYDVLLLAVLKSADESSQVTQEELDETIFEINKLIVAEDYLDESDFDDLEPLKHDELEQTDHYHHQQQQLQREQHFLGLRDKQHTGSQNMQSFAVALENHVGNNRFYILLSRFREKYMSSLRQKGEDSQDCDEIAREIYRIICDRCYPSGKFLEYNLYDFHQPWKVLQEEEAVLRVKKAFLEPPTVKLARTFPYHLVHKKGADADQHTITTGLSSFAVEEEDYGYQESAMGYSVFSDYTDSYLEGSKAASSSYQYSDSTSYASYKSDPNGLLQRHSSHSRSTSSKNRDKMDTKFRRRGVLSSFWKEHQDDDDDGYSHSQMQNPNQVHVNLKKDIFLVNTKLVDLIEKTFNEKVGRTHEIDTVVSELGSDLNQINITSHDVSSQCSKRKRPFCEKYNKAKKNTTFEIEHVKVKTDNGEIRNLSELDVLCQADASSSSLPEPLDVNHIGNNRFKAIVQLHLSRHPSHYELALPPITFRNRTIFHIMSEITNSPKGLASFVRLDNANIWIECNRMVACKILMSYLEKCLAHPNPSVFCRLPKISSPVYIEKKPSITFDLLQKVSLEVIRRRFKKKTTDIVRDVEEVQSLQSTARTLHKATKFRKER